MLDTLPGYGAFFMDVYNVQQGLLVRLESLRPLLEEALQVMFIAHPATDAYDNELSLLNQYIKVFYILFLHVPFP